MQGYTYILQTGPCKALCEVLQDPLSPVSDGTEIPPPTVLGISSEEEEGVGAARLEVHAYDHDPREVHAVVRSVRKDGRSRVSKIYKGTKGAWHHDNPTS